MRNDNSAKNIVIQSWFNALNQSDVGAGAAIFDPAGHTICNAQNPAVSGPHVAAVGLAEFFARTTYRTFTVHSVAHGEQVSFAWWTGELVFGAGVVAGHDVDTFTVTYRGIEVFRFSDDLLITEMHIIHETTSVALAALANARSPK